MRDRSSVDRDLVAVRELPLGPSRTLQAERLVAEVEVEGPEASLAFAYLVLVEAYSHGGEGAKALVPFTRALRLADSRPDLLDSWDANQLLWASKWVIAEVIETPEVPVNRVEALLEDMERRFSLAGAGFDALRYLRSIWADERAAPDADQVYDKWVATPRDEYSQCEVCDPGDRAAHLLGCGRVDEGIRLIEETLAEGRQCLSEPADMLSRVALAYLDKGRVSEAVLAHRRTLAELEKAEAPLVRVRGRALAFLARAGAYDAVIRRIRDDEAVLLAPGESAGVRLEGLVALGAAAHTVAERDPSRELISAAAGTFTIGEFADWCRGEAEAIAARFDTRYGDDHISRWMAEAWYLRHTPVDLSVLPEPSTETATETPSVAPEPEESLPDLIAGAERAAQQGAFSDAAPQYAAAARQFVEQGMLVQAGFAWAEAAHCAQILEDHVGADRAFDQAVDLLRTSGVEPALLAPVVRSWAASRCAVDRCAEILMVLTDVSSALTPTDTQSEQGKRVDRARLREIAEIDHTTARVLASTGRISEAIEAGTSATQRLAQIRADGPAAHAAWLVANLLARSGQVDDSVEWFRKAAKGMLRAGDRNQRVAVVDDLVRVLREAGRDDIASSVSDLLA